MGIITLTDRISVRVTAKNNTETSNQNKRDGGNVASALGATGLSDSEKEEVGEGLGETVTGEDGKTYAKIGNVATMYSKLYQDGKLSEPEEVHEGITDGNGFVWNLDYVVKGPAAIEVYANGSWTSYLQVDSNGYIAVFTSNYQTRSIYYFGKESFQYKFANFSWNTAVAKGATINGVNYSFFTGNGTTGTSGTSEDNMRGHTGVNQIGSNDINKLAAGYLFGPTHTTGGAKIDPTKSNADIAKDINEAAAANNAIMHFSSNPTDTYVAVTDANGNPLYFLGT